MAMDFDLYYHPDEEDEEEKKRKKQHSAKTKSEGIDFDSFIHMDDIPAYEAQIAKEQEQERLKKLWQEKQTKGPFLNVLGGY